MSMSVTNVDMPAVPVSSAEPKKPVELANNAQTQTSSAVPPQNNNGQQQDKHALLKECRDWLNSVMWGATLATGLYMTYNSMVKSNFKEVVDALHKSDANLKEVLKALGENNKSTAKIIEENNEYTKKAISENTQYLKEVIKVLDKDGDGKLSEAEIREAQMLMEEAKKWKRFTDAINEATKKK